MQQCYSFVLGIVELCVPCLLVSQSILSQSLDVVQILFFMFHSESLFLISESIIRIYKCIPLNSCEQCSEKTTMPYHIISIQLIDGHVFELFLKGICINMLSFIYIPQVTNAFIWHSSQIIGDLHVGCKEPGKFKLSEFPSSTVNCIIKRSKWRSQNKETQQALNKK